MNCSVLFFYVAEITEAADTAADTAEAD